MQRVLGICLQMIESRQDEEILFCRVSHTTGHPASNAGNGSSA